MARSRSKNLISQAEFARRLGVMPGTVSKWKSAGFIVTSHGCVDAAASEVKLAERVKTYRGGRAAGPTADDHPPANVYAELERLEPSPPALRPTVPAGKVLDSIAAVIGAVGRILPAIALREGCTTRQAYRIDVTLAVALAEAADSIADGLLGAVKVCATDDWALAAVVDDDAFWTAAAAQEGIPHDVDAWMANGTETNE